MLAELPCGPAATSGQRRRLTDQSELDVAALAGHGAQRAPREVRAARQGEAPSSDDPLDELAMSVAAAGDGVPSPAAIGEEALEVGTVDRGLRTDVDVQPPGIEALVQSLQRVEAGVEKGRAGGDLKPGDGSFQDRCAQG